MSILSQAAMAFDNETIRRYELEQQVEDLQKCIEDFDDRIRELEIALVDVMVWIDGWEPEFLDDPEWSETEARVKRALEPMEDNR